MLQHIVNDPNDIAIIVEALEAIYARRNIITLEARDECARETVAMFYSGVTDPQELIDLMSA